jgi:hypothetical protein
MCRNGEWESENSAHETTLHPPNVSYTALRRGHHLLGVQHNDLLRCDLQKLLNQLLPFFPKDGPFCHWGLEMEAEGNGCWEATRSAGELGQTALPWRCVQQQCRAAEVNTGRCGTAQNNGVSHCSPPLLVQPHAAVPKCSTVQNGALQ